MANEVKTIETPIIISQKTYAKFAERGWIDMNGRFTDKLYVAITDFLQGQIANEPSTPLPSDS